MTEPTVSSVTIAAGAITLTGSILGMDGNALLAGLFGGLVSLRYVAPMSPIGYASALGTSTLLAGVGAPVAVAAANSYLTWTQAIGREALHMACAMMIGLAAQTAVPAALAVLKRLMGASEKGKDGGGQ